MADPPGERADLHGVVDDHRQGDHQAGEDHRIDRDRPQVEDRDGGAERAHDRGEGHQPPAPVGQECEERQQEQDPAESQGDGDVVDPRLHVARRTEQRRVDAHTGQPGLEGCDGLVDGPGHLQGVGARKLLDDEHHHRADGLADQGLVVLDDGGDVPDPGACGVLERHLRQVGRSGDRQDVLDAEPLVRGVDEPTGPGGGRLEETELGHCQGVARGVDDLVKRDTLGLQGLRVHLHLELLVPLAPDRDVGHAGDTHQARPYLPPCEGGQVDERDVLGGQRDHHDPAGGGGRLDHHGRGGHVGDAGSLREALGHELPGAQQVRTGLEGQVDGGQAGDRPRVDLVEVCDPVELVLHRYGDELLHLAGGQPDRFRLYLDARRPELGQRVDPGVLCLVHPEKQ